MGEQRIKRLSSQQLNFDLTWGLMTSLRSHDFKTASELMEEIPPL
jgi:hypothetical protein